MEWPGNPRCPVLNLKKYLEKRNPECSALWQRPKPCNSKEFSASGDSKVWFAKVPVGKNKLDSMLQDMCKRAGCSVVHSPHCLRATSIKVVKASGLESCRVRNVIGHACDKSVEEYDGNCPTYEQQAATSTIVSGFLSTPNENLPSLMPLPQHHSSAIVARNQFSGAVQPQIVQQRSESRVLNESFDQSFHTAAANLAPLGRCREQWL